MDKLWNHREDVWPVLDLDRSEGAENEEGAERPAPFHPTFLKMIGSWEE